MALTSYDARDDDDDIPYEDSDEYPEPEEVIVRKARRKPNAKDKRPTDKTQRLRPGHVGGGARLQKFPDPDARISARQLYCLNVSPDYGTSRNPQSNWDSACGVRELIQNLFDAIMQVRRLQTRDIRLEELLDGKLATAEAIKAMSSAPPTKPLEIFLYDTKAAAPTPGGNNPLPVGYVAWKPSTTKAGYGDLELYNVGRIGYSAWSMGGTTKRYNPDLVGQYGDGLKIGINALIREGASVLYHTGEQVWVFGYRYGLLTFHIKKSRKKVDGVLVQVCNIPWKSLDLDRFLFLRPPAEHLPKDGKEWSRGCILLDQRHHSKIYVKGIFIREEDDDTTGLVYGVNIVEDIAMSRDRSALDDRQDAAEAIYKIWEPLILSSANARSRYVDLLLHYERSLDIEGIEDFISPACANALFAELKEQYTEDSFFFYAQETTEERRTIEEHLKKKPVLLTKIFYGALRRHKTILTPAEARAKIFHASDSFDPDKNPSPVVQHTMHALRALLHLDPLTQHFANSISFKSGYFEVLEISVEGDQVHLSENLLKPDYVHNKSGYSSCLVAQESSEEPCDCCALLIANHLTNELRVTQTVKDNLRSQQRQLVEQMPRNFLIKEQDIGGQDPSQDCRVIQWSTRERIPEKIGFALAIVQHEFDAVPKADLVRKLDQDVIGDGHTDQVKTRDGEPRMVKKKDPSFSLCDLKLNAGGRHTLQVCTGLKLAVWSVPFSFTVPPATPSGVRIETLASGHVRVRWNKAAGAASYSLQLIDTDGGSIRLLDDLQDCQWEGAIEDTALSTVRLDSFAQDGVKCLVSAEASVHDPFPSRGPTPAAEPEPAADVPMDAQSTGPSRSPSPESPSANRALLAEASPPSSAPKSPTPGAEVGDDQTPDAGKAVPGTERSSRPGAPPTPEPFMDAEPFMDPGPDMDGWQDDDSDIYAPYSPDDMFAYDDDDGDGDGDGDDDEPLDEADNFNVPAFNLFNFDLNRDLEGHTINPVNKIVGDSFDLTVGKTYRLVVHGSRQVLKIHEIISSPEAGTYIHAVRYLWASDYFKDIYGLHQTIRKEELILLIENPTSRVRVGEVDCCRILLTEIKAESLEGGEINVRHGALPTDDLTSAPGMPKTYGCRWALTSSTKTNTVKLMEFSGHPEFDPRLASPEAFDGPKPALAADATFMDLFAGCGSVAQGFNAAGFRILAAVEEQPHAATSWQLNFPDRTIHAESVQAFLSDVETKKIPSPGRVAVLSLSTPQSVANGGIQVQQLKDLQHLKIIGRVIDMLHPAYIIMDISASILNSRYRRQCQTMELDLLSRKYSLTYRYLTPAEYGVATDCGRWILTAAVSGLRLPDWPTSTHGDVKDGLKPFVTIRDAIQDLEWRNPRQPANASYEGRSVYCSNTNDNHQMPPTPYAVSLGAGVQNMVTHHTTGLAGTGEKDIPDYDKPCQSLLAQRSEGQPCYHPHHPNEFLTPRELARIVSFPDSHLFAGSITDQYKQISGAIPPLLVKAVAMQLRMVLLENYPVLIFASVTGKEEKACLPADPAVGEKRPKSEDGEDQLDDAATRPRKRVKVEIEGP